MPKGPKERKSMLPSGGSKYTQLPTGASENAEIGSPQQVFQNELFLTNHFNSQLKSLSENDTLKISHEITQDSYPFREQKYDDAIGVACKILKGNPKVKSVQFLDVESYKDVSAIVDLIKNNKTITNIQLSTGVMPKEQAEGWKKMINTALKARGPSAPKVNVDDIGVVRSNAAP